MIVVVVAAACRVMTLPVSSYEELLARVRSLTHETIQLQRALTLDDNERDHNHNGIVQT